MVSILEPAIVNKVLNAPESCKLIAYLCLGYVKTFHEVPELEKLKWDVRKNQAKSIYTDSF